MMNNCRILRFILGAILVIGFSTATYGQATRTWVSGVGDDANPCSRTAPCKTFAGAISKTANGGEIDALDPGGFGTVTIVKAITIDGTGTLAGVLNAGGINGIIVNTTTAPPAGGTTTVTLRGLTINGVQTGLNGIRILLGTNINVIDCLIQNQTQDGISYSMSTSSHATVRNTVIKNCISDGVEISTTSGAAKMTIDHSALIENGNGLHAKGNSRVVARFSNFDGNTTNGIFSDSPTAGQFSAVSVWDSMISLNGQNGVRAGNAGNVGASGATIAQNQIDRNGANGVLVSTAGAVETFKNNSIRGNTTDGCPGCTDVSPGN